jgi:hypothetical protein
MVPFGIRMHVMVREGGEEAWAAASSLVRYVDRDTVLQADTPEPVWCLVGVALLSMKATLSDLVSAGTAGNGDGGLTGRAWTV